MTLADLKLPHSKRWDPRHQTGAVPVKGRVLSATHSPPPTPRTTVSQTLQSSPQQLRKPSEGRGRKENTRSWKTSLKIRTNLPFFLTSVLGAFLPLPGRPARLNRNQQGSVPRHFLCFVPNEVRKMSSRLCADKLCNPASQGYRSIPFLMQSVLYSGVTSGFVADSGPCNVLGPSLRQHITCPGWGEESGLSSL